MFQGMGFMVKDLRVYRDMDHAVVITIKCSVFVSNRTERRTINSDISNGTITENSKIMVATTDAG